MKADAGTEAAVMKVVRRYIDSYAKRDLKGVLSLFARDSDVTVFNSNIKGKYIGHSEIKSQLERDWARSDKARFTIEWSAVSAAGSVAWIAAEGAVRAIIGGKEIHFPARLTVVLEKRKGKWFWMQGHFSLGA